MTVDVRADLFTRQWEHWHRQQEARLADPHGFLAITDLHWLTAEPQEFPDAPGSWTTGPGGPRVVLPAGDSLVVDGVTVNGGPPDAGNGMSHGYGFGVIPERGGVNAVWGDAVIEVARRGGHDIVRPRHPANPLRTAFRGTPAYAPDPRWVVAGRYEAFAEARPTTVGAAVDGLQHVYDAPGRVSFVLDGRPLSLTAFPGRAPGSLLLLFTDETSGVTTYAANRAITLDPPAPDGTVVLDFNRAANLPCAYTDLATCPLPPAENRLPVPVEAGEKIPHERAA